MKQYFLQLYKLVEELGPIRVKLTLERRGKLPEPNFGSRKILMHYMAQGEYLIDNIIDKDFIRPITSASDTCTRAFLVSNHTMYLKQDW